MKKFKYILILSLISISLGLTSCRDYDSPGPEKIYTDEDFKDLQLVSIKQVKDLYTAEYGNAVGKGLEILNNYVIKGKVISNDEAGNIYRTLYIQDETGGIEIKVGTTSNYTEYITGQIIYVKIHQLFLGNYRYNLSLGGKSSDSDYANGYIDGKFDLKRRIFKGEIKPMNVSDTIVVTSPDQLNDNMLGMLVRFEGLKSTWRTWGKDPYPSFLENRKDLGQATVYNNFGFISVLDEWNKYVSDLALWEAKGKPIGKEPQKPTTPRPSELKYPTYAFKNYIENLSYYGSALFQFGTPNDDDPTHNLILRSSGYSHFGMNPIPEDGKIADITAIYTKYSSKSGDFIKYQLVINDIDAVKIRN